MGNDGGAAGMVFLPQRSCITVRPPSTNISTVTFHLFNLPDFSGPGDYILRTGEPPRQGERRCGRAVLKADGWSATVADLDRTCDLANELKARGGYIITHVGQVAREDGADFTSEQIEDLLSCLCYFLSFALGRWAGPTLPIGFDRDGNLVFEEWGMRRTAGGPWNGSYSWLDKRHSELLAQVFPGFVTLWKNATWREPLTHALYWYLGASDRGVGIGNDTGLILAQTALELFAWTHCVQDRKMVSPGAFKPRALTAADKLRLLASSLGIPKEIPPVLSALLGRPGKKWEDGMDAITAIRNSLVHPDGANESVGTYYEAYNLSLWYIDLILLRLCGHKGNYANRLVPSRMVGTVEPVPWAGSVS